MAHYISTKKREYTRPCTSRQQRSLLLPRSIFAVAGPAGRVWAAGQACLAGSAGRSSRRLPLQRLRRRRLVSRPHCCCTHMWVQPARRHAGVRQGRQAGAGVQARIGRGQWLFCEPVHWAGRHTLATTCRQTPLMPRCRTHSVRIADPLCS